MPLRRALAALTLLAPLSLFAQTYTPKEIRMEGAPSADAADLLRVANLKPGTPITVPDIEAALQRLGDTGMFSDIHYTVDTKALVFKLTLAASAQSLPARYANFLWWQPSELERLVEARVPIFHGILPPSGTLTDQVEAALVALLREKGIDATVSAVESSDIPHGPVTSIALQITRPQIVLGKIELQDALPALKAPLEERERTLSGEDLDIVATATSIRENVADVYRNAGYLDIVTDTPLFSAPHKDEDKNASGRFLVDATAVVHAGEIYRIGRIDLPPTPPVPDSELKQAADLKVGAPASASAFRVASPEIAKVCQNRGYLGVKVKAQAAKDSATHTMAYTFNIALDDVYHLAALDISALSPSEQQAFTRNPHVAPGVIVDQNLMLALFQAWNELHPSKIPKLHRVLDSAHHTATISIQP